MWIALAPLSLLTNLGTRQWIGGSNDIFRTRGASKP